MKALLVLLWVVIVLRMFFPRYLENVLLGLDLFASALTGGRPGETLSGRIGSAYLQGTLRGRLFCPVVDVIMWAAGAFPHARGHCVHAIQGDIDRAKVVIANQMRTG